MKDILTGDIVKNVRRQQFTKSSLDHLQESYAEAIEAMLRALNVNPDVLTLLSGTMTLDGDEYSISSGWMAYQGEVFEVLARDLSTPDFSAVFKIVETFRTDDPVKFDDGSERNVHRIRRIALIDDGVGSGIANWDEVTSINGKWIPIPKPAIGVWEYPSDVPSETDAPYLAEYHDPAYLVDQMGMVHFRGAMRETSGVLDTGGTHDSGGIVLFTMPEMLRPKKMVPLYSLPIYHSINERTHKSRSGISIRTNGDLVLSEIAYFAGGDSINASFSPIGHFVYILDDCKAYRP